MGCLLPIILPVLQFRVECFNKHWMGRQRARSNLYYVYVSKHNIDFDRSTCFRGFLRNWVQKHVTPPWLSCWLTRKPLSLFHSHVDKAFVSNDSHPVAFCCSYIRVAEDSSLFWVVFSHHHTYPLIDAGKRPHTHTHTLPLTAIRLCLSCYPIDSLLTQRTGIDLELTILFEIGAVRPVSERRKILRQNTHLGKTEAWRFIKFIN